MIIERKRIHDNFIEKESDDDSWVLIDEPKTKHEVITAAPLFIKCQVCQESIEVPVDEELRLPNTVKCSYCDEDTPVIEAESEEDEYIRCSCNRLLLVDKHSTKIIRCPKPNCKRIIRESRACTPWSKLVQFITLEKKMIDRNSLKNRVLYVIIDYTILQTITCGLFILLLKCFIYFFGANDGEIPTNSNKTFDIKTGIQFVFTIAFIILSIVASLYVAEKIRKFIYRLNWIDNLPSYIIVCLLIVIYYY